MNEVQLQTKHWEDVQKLMSKALANNAWIFHTVTKTWYSPEEFFAKFSDKPYKEGWIDEHNMMYPYSGIQAANEQIRKIQDKKADFEKRVFAYYQNKLRMKICGN